MSGTYLSDGTNLSFVETAGTLPVVFLHPTPLDQDYWRPLLSLLPQVRGILPDFRGHGGSPLGRILPGGFALVPDAPVLTMAQLARDVVALLDHLQVGEAVFVGCSIGGYALLELWRQIPERMRGLAFVCSKPQPDTDAAREKRAGNIAKARAEGVAEIFEGMTQTLIGTTARRERPGIVPELRARMTLSVEAFVATQAGLATRPDSIPTVSTIRVPVLAIAGGEDGGIPPAEVEVFREAPGGCRYELIEDAGHFAAYEHPERVAEIVGDWLRGLRG